MRGEEHFAKVVTMDVGGLVQLLQKEMMEQYNNNNDAIGSGRYIAVGIGKAIEYINTACDTQYETDPANINAYHYSVIIKDN